MQQAVRFTYRTARRVAVAVVGSTVLLLGIAMIVAPGPAVVLAWARLWLRRLRRSISANNARVRSDRVENHRRR
jgi:tellurite resistance protein TerC